jgi:electron transport complex protein RnfB
MTSVDDIDALLPQTQCTRCGFPDCRAYAQAIALQNEPINRCPPGGRFTIENLAQLLNTSVLELDPDCGTESPRQVAVVDEQWCIGCTLCIQACPVDAIVGAGKRMHTVVEAWCNGCELCLPPCPVDCIVLEPPRTGPDPSLPSEWLQQLGAPMRERYRNLQDRVQKAKRLKSGSNSSNPDAQLRRERIAQAVARERQRRSQMAVAPGGESGVP